MSSAAVQICSTPSCEHPAAFKTRTQPAWCVEHIDQLFRDAGVEPIASFVDRQTFRRTQCRECGCIADYRFAYVLDQSANDEKICRACHWTWWAIGSLVRITAETGRIQAEDTEVLARISAAHGYNYLGPMHTPSYDGFPHRVECTRCGRIDVKRNGDIQWGCSCQSGGGSQTVQRPKLPGGKRATTDAQRAQKLVFKDSDSPAVTWWDHEQNSSEAWQTYLPRARKMVAWKCPSCTASFQARISDMYRWPSCPDCAEKRHAEVERHYAFLQSRTVAEIPDLLAAWDDWEDPAQVRANTGRLYKFRCPKGHRPKATPSSFLSGCSVCAVQATRRRNALAPAEVKLSRHHPELIAQFHPTKNGTWTLDRVPPTSTRTFWWRDPGCGHEWKATPAARVKFERWRCPECRTILDSLAFQFPELAGEWDPGNPLTPWQLRPLSAKGAQIAWICSQNPDHHWVASTTSRVKGSGCPQCRTSGKSRIELGYFAAAQELFGQAESGTPIAVLGGRRKRWLVDVTTQIHGHKVAIEYDGAYWHADKIQVDTEKSLDLLAAGWFVVRLREAPLPGLGLEAAGFYELLMHSASDPAEVLAQVAEMLS